MAYLVVADWDDITKRITAEARAVDLDEAESKKSIMISEGYSNAFHVLTPENSAQKYWTVDPETETVSADQAQADTDVLADSWEKLRSERNALLVSSDWTQASDSPLTDEVKTTWVTYRQELRDFPESADPADPTWPTPPE